MQMGKPYGVAPVRRMSICNCSGPYALDARIPTPRYRCAGMVVVTCQRMRRDGLGGADVHGGQADIRFVRHPGATSQSPHRCGAMAVLFVRQRLAEVAIGMPPGNPPLIPWPMAGPSHRDRRMV